MVKSSLVLLEQRARAKFTLPYETNEIQLKQSKNNYSLLQRCCTTAHDVWKFLNNNKKAFIYLFTI